MTPGGVTAMGRGHPLAGSPFVRLLGPVQFVTALGGTIDLPSATQREVLALLALDPGASIRPDLLCDRLRLSAGALRTAVSRLRGRVGAETIVTDALGYRIDCATDAQAFASLLLDRAGHPDRVVALEAALGLWRGPALDEFRHEPWSEAEVFRLDELHGLAVEDLSDAQIERGHGGDVIAAMEAHVAGHPLRDRSRGLLIRALASVGRQADALRAYQTYRQLLAEETGTEPSPEVSTIERRVAVGWDGVHGPAETPSVGPAGDPAPDSDRRLSLHPSLAHGSDRIGRDREAEVLDRQLVAAGTSGLRWVLLTGEAGVGKTTLAADFARSVHEAGRADVVYGRCQDDAADPLQPFRTVVAALVASAPTALLRDHGARCGGDLLRIAPGLVQRTWVPPPVRADDATERYQLFDAVADLLQRASSEHPLVIVLDDLHWVESTGRSLLCHLATALAEAPILVVASYRDSGDHPTDELRAALAELDGDATERIHLEGFDDEELTALVARLVGSDAPVAPSVLDMVRRESGGSPLYATQLLRHLVEVGDLTTGPAGVSLAPDHDEGVLPPSLVDLVWTRVRGLGPTAVEVLRTASVLEDDFDEDLLATLSGLSLDEVTGAVSAAQAAGVLAEEPSGRHRLRFVHGLVAHALYADLDGPARRLRHHRAADVLEQRGGHLPMQTVAQLARHRAQAGDPVAAQRWASLAGERAMARLAAAESCSWHETALDHARAAGRPDAEMASLLVALGTAQVRAGDPQGQTNLREAAALARRVGAHEVLVDATIASDRGHVRVVEVDLDQLDVVEAALSVVDPGDPARRARLLAIYAQELVHTPRLEDRRAAALEAVALIERAEDPMLLPQLVSALTAALWGPGTLALRRDLAERAIAIARSGTDPVVLYRASQAEYCTAIESAEPEVAAAALARMRAITTRLGEPRLQWATGTLETFEATMAARLDEAETIVERNLELGLRIGEPDAFSMYGGQLYVLRSFAGRYDELVTLVEGLLLANPTSLAFRLAFGICCAVVGRREEATTILDDGAAQGFAEIPFDFFWMTSLTGYAVLALELDDRDRAEPLYRALEPFADEVVFNGASSQGPIAAYLGKLASLQGRHDVADRHLQRALTLATRCGWRYHEATTALALGRSARRRRGVLDDEGRAWLDRAERLARACSLPGVLQQVSCLREEASTTS